MANILSAMILALFFYGRSLRFKNNPLHRRLMVLSFVLDLLLVIGLVIFRQALSKVNPQMPVTLMIHVPIAVSTLVLYGSAIYTGYRLSKGAPVRGLLRILDRLLVTFRVLTLVTSIMVQFQKVPGSFLGSYRVIHKSTTSIASENLQR